MANNKWIKKRLIVDVVKFIWLLPKSGAVEFMSKIHFLHEHKIILNRIIIIL